MTVVLFPAEQSKLSWMAQDLLLAPALAAKLLVICGAGVGASQRRTWAYRNFPSCLWCGDVGQTNSSLIPAPTSLI